MLAISALPQYVQPDATSLVIFNGPPNVALSWVLIGDGTLEDAASFTGANGHASARFVPGATLGTSFIEVTYGT